MRWNSADPPGNSADPPGNMKKEKENATERLAFSFFIFCGTGFALENRFHWLCGQVSANRTGARATFSLSSGTGFALENRFHWLCGQASANRTGARVAFSALSAAPVCVRKPNSLALRATVRKPHRGPGHFFCSLADRNRRKGFSYICRKMFRLRFQKIFCRYSNFSGLCSRNSSKGLFNDFSETFQVRTTF